MRHIMIPSIFLVVLGSCGSPGHNELLSYKKYFDSDLKLWAAGFKDFGLSKFSPHETIRFDSIREEEFKDYDSSMSIYKPILTFSPDSSQFIDIYSGQLGLVKEGDHYEANPDDGQPVVLCNTGKRYRKRIYYGAPGGWIDEVVWVSPTKFILAGIEKWGKDEKRVPVILLGDTYAQKMERYTPLGEDCYQTSNGYESPKLRRMNIK